jgi:hypothetical protein
VIRPRIATTNPIINLLKIIFHIIGLHQKFCPPPLEAKKAQRNQNKIPRMSDIAILLTITLEKTHFFVIIENLKIKLSQNKVFLYFS